MEVTPEFVKKVAENARLKLTEEEVKKYAKDMAEFLTDFKKLANVDTKGIQPSFHPIPVKNAAREDIPGECLDREKALELSKHRTDKYFKGPKVI